MNKEHILLKGLNGNSRNLKKKKKNMNSDKK